MDTETKLNILQKSFPNFEVTSLLEILISCDGSVEAVKSLLFGDEFTEDQPQQTENEILESKTEHEPMKFEVLKNLPEKSTLITQKDIKQHATAKKRTLDDAIGAQSPIEIIAKISKPNSSSLTDRTITLYTKQEIENALPNVRIFKNFLPKGLSDKVLDSVMQQKLLFKAKQFYIAGNLCKSSQMTVCFSEDGRMDYDPVYKTDDTKPIKMTDEMNQCRSYVDEKMNEVLKEIYGDKSIDKNEKPKFIRTENWRSNFCIGNYFPNNKSHLDWHTDKLTNIGPLPAIASLSVGATRIFRLRRSNPTNSAIYNIPLAHNTMLIMLPSTQELFKHCVPTLKDSLVKSHPIVGESRFSLTFRMAYPPLENKKVYCDICQKQMILRRLFKGPDIGYYYWQCMGSFKGRSCKGFKYAKFDDSGEFSTSTRINATRWLSPLENDLLIK